MVRKIKDKGIARRKKEQAKEEVLSKREEALQKKSPAQRKRIGSDQIVWGIIISAILIILFIIWINNILTENRLTTSYSPEPITTPSVQDTDLGTVNSDNFSDSSGNLESNITQITVDEDGNVINTSSENSKDNKEN